MNLENHLQKIYSILGQYTPIWQNEVLNYYPAGLDAYSSDWVEQVQQLSIQDRWLLDSKQSFESLEKGELKDLLLSLFNLTKLPNDLIEKKPIKLTRKDFHKIKPKKEHEITEILSYLNSKKIECSHYVDIGGGVGHLSRLCSQFLNSKAICFEMNPYFVELGKKQIHSECDVHFVNHKIESYHEIKNKSDQSNLKKEFSHDSFCLGLHTCGNLANSIIETNIKYQTKGLLNFGCCYFKCTPETDVNTSKEAQKYNLAFTKHALTLASRAHTGLTLKDFQKKLRVKQFRYALHLFLYYEVGVSKFTQVGESKYRDYLQDFAHYAKIKLNYLNIKNSFCSKTLNDWFNQKEIQEKIDQMFCANIIRWQFGRSLEHWILTDRVLYLRENGFEANLGEFFNEKISPRNIGIWAYSKN